MNNVVGSRSWNIASPAALNLALAGWKHSFSFIKSKQRNVECFITCYVFHRSTVCKTICFTSSRNNHFQVHQQHTIFHFSRSSFVLTSRYEPVGFSVSRAKVLNKTNKILTWLAYNKEIKKKVQMRNVWVIFFSSKFNQE